jgi:hypothetical protein
VKKELSSTLPEYSSRRKHEHSTGCKCLCPTDTLRALTSFVIVYVCSAHRDSEKGELIID